MLKYPTTIELNDLEVKNKRYDDLIGVWSQIDDLITGGHVLEAKKRSYIVRRPDEDPKLYELRLAKFVYTPVLGEAVREYTTKITTAPFHVSVNGSEWESFRQSTDGKGRDEKELLNTVFRDLITYGVCWLSIDKAQLSVTPRNKLDEEILGGSQPYTVRFSPLEVIHWQPSKTGGVEWVKVRQIFEENNPFGETKYRAVWTIIDDENIVKYSALVKLDASGNISGLDVGKSNQRPDNTASKGLVGLVEGYPLLHGRGRCPVVNHWISPELWSCNEAYLKAKQHLQIENSWTDTATIAGYIQRLFKPTKPTSDNDPNFTFDDTSEELEAIKSSNQHLLIGDDFKFAEASGSSLQVISEYVLDKIEAQIKSIVSMGALSMYKKSSSTAQSGASKEMDYTQLNTTMKRYGSLLVEIYEDVLRQVGRAFGIRDEGKLNDINVTGLDTFDIDTADNLLTKAEKVSKIESRLSPTTKKLWYLKIAESLHASLDSEAKEELRKEYDAMSWEDTEVVEPTVEPTNEQQPTKPPTKKKTNQRQNIAR